MRRFSLVLLLLFVAAPAWAQQSSERDRAVILATRSQRFFGELRPVVTREIAGLTSLSRVRSLAPQEEARLAALRALCRIVDDWARIRGAYLDVVGAIDYFLEKSDRNVGDERRLRQLLTGLPKNNRNLESAVDRVVLAARALGLKTEN